MIEKVKATHNIGNNNVANEFDTVSIVDDNLIESRSPAKETRLTTLAGWAYALPALPVFFLHGMISVLPGIYAKYFGLTLGAISALLLVSRLFDAITDPTIGYFTDKYYTSQGSRKPFIVIGGFLFVISSWFLCVPFDFETLQPTTNASATYFLIWLLAFYLFYTIFEIPHLAWGSDLVTDSQEKNKIYSMRYVFVYLGSLLFYVIPLLPMFDTNEITPDTLKWSVVIAGVIIVPLMYFSVKIIPNPQAIKICNQKDVSTPVNKVTGFNKTLISIIANKPFQIMTVAQICTGFGLGMWFPIFFIFVDSYLSLGSHFAFISAISFCIGVGSLKLWYQIANTWGKQTTWAIGMIVVITGLIGTGLVSPRHTSWISVLLCKTLVTSGFAAASIMMPSLLSDIIDYGRWKFNIDCTATYFSIFTFINKTVVALGSALGLAVAGWLNFDPTSTLHNDTAVLGLRLGVSWIPLFFILLSIIFLIRIPVTMHRHAIIRRRLDSRQSYLKSQNG